jgi:hypothetical protein
MRTVDPTVAPVTGAVLFKTGKGVASGSAPSLVTVAGGGTAETEPVAVLTAGAVSVTTMVESSVPESVEDAIVVLFVVAAIVLVIEEEIEEEIEDETLELFRMCPSSQTDNSVPQELASVQRLSGLVFGALFPHCERETFQAPPSVQRTSSCHDARDMVEGCGRERRKISPQWMYER